MSSASLLGRMDRCSRLTTAAAPRTPRDSHLGSALDSNRTGPTDAGSDEELTTGFHNRIGLGWDAQPNEMRLSCGARLEYSQMEFY